MGLETEKQDRIYEEHWRPMEILFGQKNYNDHFDNFIRYYLITKTGDIPRQNEVYDAFKAYAKSIKVEKLMTDLRRFAEYIL